jgi:glyoxylase-like metal-dependent hydrolase (beta-lactamase superfamily II)
VLEGSGGNIGVLTGGDGKLLIDAGITASKSRLLEALGELTKDPVKTLINTHWHFDHSDGNIWLHEQGAIIIAHENTRKHLLSMQRVEDWDFNFPPLPSAGIPTEIFSDAKTIEFNNMTLSLNHYAPAHTDSDISVRFTEADVIHVGDTYWNGIYPFIDYSTGGSIGGMIQACEDNLANTTEDTIIIAGHGAPLSNRSELKAFRDMLLGAYENVSRLKRQGLSLKETVAANPTGRYDEKWGQYVITPMLFTKLIYEGC